MKNNRFSQTFNYCKRWGFKTEIEVYRHIMLTRPHVSFFTGQPISNPQPHNFIHILAKGLAHYPHYRLNPDNIVLGTWEEHKLIDEGSEKDIAKYKKEHPNFDLQVFMQIKNKLKDNYEKEFR